MSRGFIALASSAAFVFSVHVASVDAQHGQSTAPHGASTTTHSTTHGAAAKPPTTSHGASTHQSTHGPTTHGSSTHGSTTHGSTTHGASANAHATGSGKPVKSTSTTTTTKSTSTTTTAAGSTSTTTTILTPVQQKLQKNTNLASKLQSRLPIGTDLMTAAEGFRNLGQFVAAVNVSNNLHIPFDQLKADMVTKKMSLGQSIQDLRPSASSTIEAQHAEYEADSMISETTTTTTTTTSTTSSTSKAKTKKKTTKPHTSGGE